MGIKLIPVETRTPEDLDPVFPALARERVDAVIVLRAPLFFSQRRTIAAAALAARLPTIFALRENVDDGGLISYGINLSQNFRRSADYVVKILKGAKPGDLPVEFPTKLELVINLPTAKALGVCTENLILVDYVTESPNVNGDDRVALLLPDSVHLAVQVEEPT